MSGEGQPVVWIQTALTADELMPAAGLVTQNGRYRTVAYHRRGYAGSSPTSGEGSVTRDAQDCCVLMNGLGLDEAHIVGVSYSAASAMQVAADAPGKVASLCLVEPPPVHVRSAGEFRAVNAEILEQYRTLGAQPTVERFMSRLVGPDWRYEIEQRLPGGVEQIEADAATFFGTDIPALLSWRFTAADAARISAPVLYVGGSDSGGWFAQVPELMLDWFPGAEHVVIPGADHSLALTHAHELSVAMTDFFDRHPLGMPEDDRG